jgi:hypothetical protein
MRFIALYSFLWIFMECNSLHTASNRTSKGWFHDLDKPIWQVQFNRFMQDSGICFKHDEMAHSTGLVEAVIFETKDRDKIGATSYAMGLLHYAVLQTLPS